jgi:enoyl-CoA hydratase/carnithine racemase
MTLVQYLRDDRTARITLNRPEVRNAVSQQLLRDLLACLDRALAAPEVEVILLRGSGPDFCAGEDLNELADISFDEIEAAKVIHAYQDVTRRIMLGTKPVVCAVQGWAIGAGAAWPLNADFTVWATDSKLRFPEARHRLYASGGVTYLLERTCGATRARELLWLEAVSAGDLLIHDRLARTLVSPNDINSATEELIDRLLGLPPASLSRYKIAQSELLAPLLEPALQSEAEQMLAAARMLLERGA